MAKFKCWDPDEEDRDSAKTREAHAVRDAATDYARGLWDKSDYFKYVTIRVEDEQGKTFDVEVTVESVPDFRADSVTLCVADTDTDNLLP